MKVIYLIGLMFSLLIQSEKEKIFNFDGNYTVVWGEFGIAQYGGKVKHLCISSVKSRRCLSNSTQTPSFVNSFNEVVYGKYPDAKSYTSGYKSLYKCFDNEDDASTFRQNLINNSVKVDYINW